MDLQLIRFAIGMIAVGACTVIVLFYLYAKLLVSKESKIESDTSNHGR